MRAWTWPSWAGIGIGVVSTGFGKVMWLLDPAGFAASPAGWFILGGAVLLATGLLGLQLTYNACCDWDEGCGCECCEACDNGSCCGKCGCGPKDEPAVAIS